MRPTGSTPSVWGNSIGKRETPSRTSTSRWLSADAVTSTTTSPDARVGSGAPRSGARRRCRTRGRRRPSRLRSSLSNTLVFKSDIRDSSKAMASLQTARSFLFAPGARSGSSFGRSSRAPTPWSPTSRTRSRRPRRPRRARPRDAAHRPRRAPAVRLVRVNGVGTEWHDADVAAVAASGIDGVVVPKATADAVRAVGEPSTCRSSRSSRRPTGLREAFEIASDERVMVLMLGAIDLGLELGLEPRDDGQEILFARSSLVVDSAAAGPARPRRPGLGRRPRPRRASRATASSAARSASAARRSSTPTRSRRPTRRSPPPRTSSGGRGRSSRPTSAPSAKGGASSRSTAR